MPAAATRIKTSDDPISGIGMSDSSSGFPICTSRTALILVDTQNYVNLRGSTSPLALSGRLAAIAIERDPPAAERSTPSSHKSQVVSRS